MDLNKKKYIILELIPTSINTENGLIVQVSALKLDGIKIIDRFDYRLKEEKIPFPQFIELLNYDKESFIYKDSDVEIMKSLKTWSEDLPILIIDNEYTKNYLSKMNNKIESILDYLGESYSDDIIDKLIKKYNLEPSNYIVDLLYESLIKEI